MPMETAFWGDYFGMCTDKFGIQWMISYPLAQEGHTDVAMEGSVASL
jgi:PhnB protein